MGGRVPAYAVAALCALLPQRAWGADTYIGGWPTNTSTLTETFTATLTESLPATRNYTMDMAPYAFQEGEEVRIKLQTTVDGSSGGESEARVVKALNATGAEFDIRMYTYSSSTGTSCSSYVSGGSLLASRTEYGFATAESSSQLGYVSTAYATFAAPPAATTFVICFKLVKGNDFQDTSAVNAWQLFVRDDREYTFTGASSSVWYYLPDPTVGQYAIVQLLSQKTTGFNFTYSPSACATSVASCTGDNLKIVPRGEPCTHEHQTYGRTYPGSNIVTASTGAWSSTSYLQEGATAGGFGAFGTQYANPLVDSWSSGGSYFTANEESANVTNDPTLGITSHAYVYVRLPQTAADYDVCFSSVAERKDWAAYAALMTATHVESRPMWRKLPRCTLSSACSSNAANLHFGAAAEPVGWSMVDLSPGTWGDIVFDDSGAAQLSNAAAVSTVIVSAPIAAGAAPLVKTETANYWAPTGGDYFRLVSPSSFTETTTVGSAYTPAGVGDFQGRYTASTGSAPSAGCWSRALDTPSSSTAHGGWAEDAVPYASGSRDLRGDPTSSAAEHDATTGQEAVFSTLWLPSQSTRWYVCYRRTCTHSGATCAQNSGLRVLPFHKGGRGSTPHKWLNLNDSYTPGLATTSAHLLVPAQYANEESIGASTNGYPADATWYMNDTRSLTWGPIVVEKLNTTGDPDLDTRPWNLQRTYATYDRVRDTQGSTLHVVGSTKPCDYPGFTGSTGQGARSTDGGMVECNNADAWDAGVAGCLGSTSDLVSVANAAFYITVPDVGASYKVCYRLRGFNWRQLSGSATTGAWNDPTNPMPDATLERGGWESPSSGYLTPAASALGTLGVEGTEDRAGAESLFIVTDSASRLSAAPRKSCTGGCPSSGDVFRLVGAANGCDITPGRWAVEKDQADSHLSLLCRVAGSGTPALSGLYAQAPCATAVNTQAMCQGVVCNTSSPQLVAMAARTPDLYDDLVPADEVHYGLSTAAAVVILPAYDAVTAANNFYKVCYKQMETDNWAVFNETWEVKPAQGLWLSSPPRLTQRLVGGELQKFTLMTTTALPRDTTSGANLFQFYAKLVKDAPGVQNNNCVNQAGSTEGEIYAAATTQFLLVPNTLNNSVEFYLTAPHEPGNYRLCVQLRRSAEDSMSWWRPGSASASHDYTILDNGVRWYVTPGYQPTNQGLSIVKFLRCSPQSDGSCSRTLNQDSFDTDAGKDAAKIIDVASHCHGNSTIVSGWGASTHVGVEGSGIGGITDLGPANGPSDVAEIRVVLPAITSDAQTAYKVCVKTTVYQVGIGGSAGQTRWIEVQQATDLSGQHVVRRATGYPGFRTEQGLVASWTLASALQPKTSLFTGPLSSASVGLAGASTQYVSDPTTATTTATQGNGFHFTTYSAVTTELRTSNLFKLVAVKKPGSRLPSSPSVAAEWGTQSSWTTLGVDCLSPAADTASNVDPCSDPDTTVGSAFCPQVPTVTETTTFTIPAHFHIPLDPGSYLVCYKVAHANLTTPKPWLMLASSSGSDYNLHAHPTFLEMQASADQRNVTAYDIRAMANWDGSGTQVSVSSWCGGTAGGVNCGVQNAGFTSDLLTLVNDTQVCPAPTLAPTGSATGPPQWFQMTRTTNITSGVSVTWTDTTNAFVLPPVSPATTGQYKVCLYKAGEATVTQLANGSAQAVAKQGVVYQLYNRGTAVNGGGSGYWTSTGVTGQPTKLIVSTDLEYNSTIRFVQYASTLETTHGDVAVPEALVTTQGVVSRTPLLTSGTTVEYVVRVATSTDAPLPHGSYAIEVRRCHQASTFESLACAETAQDLPPVDPGTFVAWNVGGTCAQERAEAYGWVSNGLRQFTQAGVVRFALQYRSACPSGVFGCGVRFVATTTEGTSLWSAAQWVNVQGHLPNAVAIDGHDTEPAVAGVANSTLGCVGVSATSCYMKTCQHGQRCELLFQARYQGPSEFAPTGNFVLRYAVQDYGADYPGTGTPSDATRILGNSALVGNLVPDIAISWRLGGMYLHAFTPVLTGDLTEGVVYLNATYGLHGAGEWTRLAVRVVKATPASVDIASVHPVDLGLSARTGRTPAPAFVPGTAPSGVSMVATPGSYLEALVPYVMTYVPRAADGVALPQVFGALDGWKISGNIQGTTTGFVLHNLADDAALVTQPRLLQDAVLTNSAIGATFSFDIAFRLYVADNTCSRFTTAGGCSVVFTFSHATLASVSTTLVTPVRVPASTVEVTTVPQNGVSTVREGIVVTVKPGSYITGPDDVIVFVRDEFHYGDAFGLVVGPAPADGATNRDNLTLLRDAGSSGCAYEGSVSGGDCAVDRYPMEHLGTSAGWGASWMMRPDRPCNRCQFTFHTTWGAGPESLQLTPVGTQRGVSTLTWSGDSIILTCSSSSAPLPVPYGSDSVRSDYFDLTVTAGVSGVVGASALYPRWWVFTDTNSTDVNHITGAGASKYTLMQKNSAPATTVLRARMGEGAVASFPGLYFYGNGSVPEQSLNEDFAVTFHAMAKQYSSGASAPVGSRPSGTSAQACSWLLSLQRREVTPAPDVHSVETTRIKLMSVEGASMLCQHGTLPSACFDYETDVSTLAQSGLKVTVMFEKSTTDTDATTVDTTLRNVTIVPIGNGRSSPLMAPAWTYSSASAAWNSANIVLDSYYNPAGGILPVINGNSYTYGHLNVLAERPRPNAQHHAVVDNGVGTITLKYGRTEATTVDKGPVRRAQFKVCESQWDPLGTFEATSTSTLLCVTLNLWVKPGTVALRTVFVTEHPTTQVVRGVSASCGAAQAVTFQVAPYYTVNTMASQTLRYYEYTTPIQYTLATLPQQAMVRTTESTSSLTLVAANAVLASDAVNHTRPTSDLYVSFSFFGVNKISENTTVTVAATDTAQGSQVASATSATTYQWTDLSETYSQWSISDTVTTDDECPTKRRLQTSTSNYRTYGTGAPGLGWAYGTGAVVGVPFPVETMVKNTAGARAFSFADDTLVKVSKLGWRGCNNGGTLRTYRMQPSTLHETEKLLTGVTAQSWNLGQSQAAVLTKGGVATPWLVFDSECEECTVQLDLCYTGATAVTCLDPTVSTAASDVLPIFADRTKVTKPFAVQKQAMQLVEVYNQTLPATSDIMVGDSFTVKVESVQRFGTGLWAMNEVGSSSGWNREVWVSSLWTGDHATTSSVMQYGYGGFMHDGAARASTSSPSVGCNAALSEDEFAAAATKPQLAVSSGGVLHFFFGRPCSSCKVRLSYRLTPPLRMRASHAVVEGAFNLKAYETWQPGSDLVYKVATCGMQWRLRGVPPAAVRRRRPFSLTALRVDGHNMPSWEGGAGAALVATLSSGNGGGSRPVVTSPLSAAGVALPVNGSAMVRVEYGRACYRCAVTFAGEAHHLTVLTDATQIVAIPRYSENEVVQVMTATSQAASWAFELYAADDLGDRAYTVAGPTEFAHRLPYQTPASGVPSAVLAVRGTTSALPAVQMSDGTLRLTSLTRGTPAPSVSSGSTCYNGVPVDGGGVGMATVSLSGASGPVTDMDLTLTMGAGSSPRTSYFGSKKTPRVHFTVPAVRMAIDQPAASSATGEACRGVMAQGEESCTFHAYAAGRVPGAPDSDSQWYVSVLEKGEATATVACGACGAATVTSEARFEGGVASFELELESIALDATVCTCAVTVSPPASLRAVNATDQSFSVMYTKTTLATWRWESSSTLRVGAGLSTQAATSVFNRSVTLGMKAYDSNGKLSGLGVSWQGRSTITLQPSAMVPEGCFTCAGLITTAGPVTTYSCPVTRSTRGDELELVGVFRHLGVCSVPVSAVSGLPVGSGLTVNAATSLQVTVEAPASLAVVSAEHEGEVATNFSGLWGRTHGGAPAAVVGIGSSLTFRIVDSTGAQTSGDNHMEVTLVGSRVGNTSGSTSWELSSVAMDGEVTFELEGTDVTRSIECGLKESLSESDVCEHVPWYFEVQARAPMTTTGVSPVLEAFAAVHRLGPLYFVRRVHKLVAFADLAEPCVDRETEAPLAVLLSGRATYWLKPPPICPHMYDATPSEQALLDLARTGYVPLGRVDDDSKATSHEGRGDKGGRHSANAGYGFNFTMMVMALDATSLVVEHPEDLGHDAEVMFRPMAVPCRNIDAVAGWAASTCITGGSCEWGRTIPTLPACQQEASGWQLPSDLFKFKLQRGRATFDTVSYGEGVGLRSGLTRFMLSTTQLNHGWEKGWTSASPLNTFGALDDSFLFEINMQETAALRPSNSTGWECTADNVCTPTTGWRVEPDFTFAVAFAAVDHMGDVVEADSGSHLTVKGQCLDASNDAYLYYVRESSFRDPLVPPTYGLSRGVALLDRLGVSGGECERMELSITCTSGPQDAKQNCAGKSATWVFPVRYPGTHPPVFPAPATYPILVTGLRLGQFMEPVGLSLFVQGLNFGDMEGLLLRLLRSRIPIVKAVLVQFVCTLTDETAITNEHRASDTTCIRIREPATSHREEEAKGRLGAVLQSTTNVVTELHVSLSAPVGSYAVAANMIADVIVDDLQKTDSVLRAPLGTVASPFANTVADGIAVSALGSPPPVSAAPGTPFPPVHTPAPPTPVTPSPQTSQPPQDTLVPPTSPTPSRGEVACAWASLPNLTLLLLTAVLAVLL